MPSNRPHTARKPVGSGTAFQPVPEYGPSAGQITSSPYVNAIPSARSDLSVDAQYDASSRRHSRESVNSDRFFDTEQQPDPDGGAATGVTTQTTSPTIAQAPQLFPQNTPAHLYHRFDSRHRDQRGYQRLPSEGPESTSQAASRTPSNTTSTATGHAWGAPDSPQLSSTTSLPRPEQPLRQHPAYQTYTSAHSSPASQYSEYATQPLSMPDPDLSSPVPDMPMHPVPSLAPAHAAPLSSHHTLSANAPGPVHTSSSSSSSSAAAAPYGAAPSIPYPYGSAQDSRPARLDAYPHFKRPYLESAEDRNVAGEQPEWYASVPPPQAAHELPAKPPSIPRFGPYSVYEPYGRDAHSTGDDTRDSSDRSLSPEHSVSTERDSSLSLTSEPAVNPAGAPAAVAELPPGVLYRRQVSTSARPRQGTPLTLASLANRNSSSELSPRASGTQIDTPSSLASYAPYASPALPTESPVSDHRSDAASRASRASGASFGAASQSSRASRAGRDGRDAPAPEPEAEPRAAKPKDEKESLGIGVGSAYVQRIRVDAAETHISKVPAVLPIGLRARAKSTAARIQPEFLRKAMDIRYTHLPQRMLETEVDDDDVPLGQQQPPGVQALGSAHAPGPPAPGMPARAPSPPSQYDTLDPTRRSHSPVESVMERTGKIKLFVANPDDESD